MLPDASLHNASLHVCHIKLLLQDKLRMAGAATRSQQLTNNAAILLCSTAQHMGCRCKLCYLTVQLVQEHSVVQCIVEGYYELIMLDINCLALS